MVLKQDPAIWRGRTYILHDGALGRGLEFKEDYVDDMHDWDGELGFWFIVWRQLFIGKVLSSRLGRHPPLIQG